MPLLPWATVAILTCGCGTASNVALNVAIGALVAADRASEGECLTPCVHGTRCNPATRLCERLPCGQDCPLGEQCDELLSPPRCTPAAAVGPGLGVRQAGHEQPAGAAAQTTQP